MKASNTPAFSANDRAEAWDGAQWRPCVVLKYAPYRNRDGWYIQWTDLPKREKNTDPMPSSGGWKFQLRAMESGVIRTFKCGRCCQPIDLCRCAPSNQSTP